MQGVGFRWFVRERARALKLAGWVRNLDDGGVEIAASGPDEAVADLLSAVEQGPPGARVHEVLRRDAPPTLQLPKPFSVLR